MGWLERFHLSPYRTWEGRSQCHCSWPAVPLLVWLQKYHGWLLVHTAWLEEILDIHFTGANPVWAKVLKKNGIKSSNQQVVEVKVAFFMNNKQVFQLCIIVEYNSWRMKMDPSQKRIYSTVLVKPNQYLYMQKSLYNTVNFSGNFWWQCGPSTCVCTNYYHSVA